MNSFTKNLFAFREEEEMKKIVNLMEETLNNISAIELKKNPKASAKALEIKRMISELKAYVQNLKTENQGVLKYLSAKKLLEK